jgi:hypothetical protein
MHTLLKFSSITIAFALAAFGPSASAQEVAISSCQNFGGGPPEPLGDREGHSIQISQVSCRVESGPLKGGVLSGMDIFEWNGTNADQIAANGVIRSPEGTAVYEEKGGKLALTMTDGKVTGFTFTGAVGTYLMGSGSAAGLTGKSWTVVIKPTGPGQFTAEATMK